VRAQKREPSLKVVIGHAQGLVREAVRARVGAQAGMSVMAVASDTAEVLDALDRDLPDVLLLEWELVCTAEVDQRAKLTSHLGRVPSLVFGEENLDALVQALRAGARGWITSDESLDSLVSHLRAVLRGDVVVPPPLAGRVLPALLEGDRDREDLRRLIGRLTRREQEVLRLLAEGQDPVEIAGTLHISLQTVRTHIQRILGKLEVHSRTAAVSLAIRAGILDSTQDVSY
jgi:DNA-binding NarL/FixJ family response regulator